MTESVDIVVPESEEASEATVLSWSKSVGDSVSEHEPLLELSTDKVTVEVAATASGVLVEILCDADAVVHPGTVLGRISIAAAGGASAQSDGGMTDSMSAPVADDEIDWSDPNPEEFSGYRLSPLVRRMLRENNLLPSEITGTGREGRITHRDVLAHLAGDDSIEPAVTSAPQQTRIEQQGPVSEVAEANKSFDNPVTRIPHSSMRRSIATHMVDSMLRTAPHVTSVFDADLTAVLAHKNANREEAMRRGTRLTLTSYFVKALALAIERVPQINSRWQDDALEVFRSVNVGIATALGDEGLIVPVVKRVEGMDLWEIAAAVTDTTVRARARALNMSDVEGGTITITNHGVSGSLIATPIINQPQSAILGVGRLEKRVRVVTIDRRDTLQILPMIYATLTIDHRALDGYQANQFLTAFVDTLENWS